MKYLLEILLISAVLVLIGSFIVITITAAFDMSIPEIIDWWEERNEKEGKKMKKDDE